MDSLIAVLAIQFAVVVAGIVVPKRYGPRRADNDGRLSTILRAGVVIFGPGVLGFVLVAVVGVAQYQGTCGGWLDSKPVPCSFAAYVDQSIFWSAMLMLVPGAVSVLLASGVVFYRLASRNRS